MRAICNCGTGAALQNGRISDFWKSGDRKRAFTSGKACCVRLTPQVKMRTLSSKDDRRAFPWTRGRTTSSRHLMRNLIIILGDQLNADSAALDDFDPAQDVI